MAKVIIEVNDNYVDQIESFLGRFKSGYSQANPLKSSLEYLADNRKAKNELAKFSDIEIKVDDIDKANAIIQNADKYKDEFLKIAHCYLNAVIHNMTQCEKRAIDNTDKRTANANLRGLNGIKAELEDEMKEEGIKFKADEKKIKVVKVAVNDTVDNNGAKIINGTIKKSINKSAVTILSTAFAGALIIGATLWCTNNANSKPDKNNGSVTQSETKQPKETDFIINSWYEPKTEAQTELVTEPETTKETERLTEPETVAVTEPVTEPDTEQETEKDPFDDIFDGIDTDINESEDFENGEETAIADEDAKLRREDRNYNVVEPTDDDQNEQ